MEFELSEFYDEDELVGLTIAENHVGVFCLFVCFSCFCFSYFQYRFKRVLWLCIHIVFVVFSKHETKAV